MSSMSASSTSTTLSESARMTLTPGRLRADSSSRSSRGGLHDEHPAADPESAQVADQLARLDGLHVEVLDDLDGAVAELGA